MVKSVKLFTPIDYSLFKHGDVKPTFGQWAVEKIDGYFHLSGKKAYVIPPHLANSKQAILIDDRKPLLKRVLLGALKVLSYATIVFPALLLCVKLAMRSSREKLTISTDQSVKATILGSPDPVNLPLTGKKTIGALYQILHVVDKVFKKHNITWWLNGGSALGMERHGSIIPWDDDVDICILPGDEKKLLNAEFLEEKVNVTDLRKNQVRWKIIKSKLEQSLGIAWKEGEFTNKSGDKVILTNQDLYDSRCLFLQDYPEKTESNYKEIMEFQKKEILRQGCQIPLNGMTSNLIKKEIQEDFAQAGLRVVADNWQGFKVFSQDCHDFSHAAHCGPTAGWTTTPHIDIFATRKQQDEKGVKYVLTKRAYECWPNDYFYEHELFGEAKAMRRVPFGPIAASTAQDNRGYLERGYGKQCMKKAKRCFDHAKGKAVSMEEVVITHFHPAQYEFPFSAIHLG